VSGNITDTPSGSVEVLASGTHGDGDLLDLRRESSDAREWDII
jgi:hypothetical protein